MLTRPRMCLRKLYHPQIDLNETNNHYENYAPYFPLRTKATTRGRRCCRRRRVVARAVVASGGVDALIPSIYAPAAFSSDMTALALDFPFRPWHNWCIESGKAERHKVET